MKLNFGNNATLMFSGGMKTQAGTDLLTASRTFVVPTGGMRTSSGSIVFDGSNPLFDNTTGASTGLKGFKCPIPFTCNGQTVSVTTYVSLGGGAGNQGTMDSFYNVNTVAAAYGYIPFNGSVLGVGVRCRNPRTAGSATFVVMNGATTLTSVTLNSTNTKVANGALIAQGTKTFTANNLRVKIKTSGAWAPGYVNPFSGIVWVSI